MTGLADELAHRWQNLAEEMAWPKTSARAIGDELISRYGEEHRRYHDQSHVLAVLDALEDLGGGTVTAEARLAAWYHDAIYEGVPGEDEEASARLAESHLRDLGLADAKVERVARAVRATARHFDPDRDQDDETALVLDADLSPLAADAATYDANSRAIRAEYSHVPDDAFRTGRLAVIDALLARDRLFLTPAGRARYEDAARANLNRERDRLVDG